MTQFPHDVSVAIIAHNARNRLPATLESLRRAGCPPTQITVVDVASSDGSPDWLKQQWPDVHVARLHSNNGPNPARNIGIINARTPRVLLMDDDVEVEPTTVPLLKCAMDRDPSIAIASPIVVYDTQPDTIQYAGTGVHFLGEAVNPWQGRPVWERGDEPQEIGCASANALLTSRAAAIQVGLFDQRYFVGKEDGDFTHRVRLAGYKIMEVPQARVLHNKRPRGTGLFYYQLRNRWHFILKNYELRTLLLLTPAFLMHELLQAGLLTYKGHGITYLKAIGGLMRMLAALPADRTTIAGFRVRRDRDVLLSGPIVIREDFISNSFVRRAKGVYDRILHGYWNCLTGRVL